jgi:hypothetical protein
VEYKGQAVNSNTVLPLPPFSFHLELSGPVTYFRSCDISIIMRLKVLLLVSLQTLGTRALYQFPSSSDNINSRDGKFDILSCADVCPLTDTIYGDREHNREIWNKVEVNGWFEIWLKAVPYSNWPNHIAEYIWPKQTPNFNCASLSGACKPMDDNCCTYTLSQILIESKHSQQ